MIYRAPYAVFILTSGIAQSPVLVYTVMIKYSVVGEDYE